MSFIFLEQGWNTARGGRAVAAGKRKSLISCPRPPTTRHFQRIDEDSLETKQVEKNARIVVTFTNLIRSFLLNLAHGRTELFLHPASSIDFRFINWIFPSEIISTFRKRKAEREGAPPFLYSGLSNRGGREGGKRPPK